MLHSDLQKLVIGSSVPLKRVNKLGKYSESKQEQQQPIEYIQN